MNETLTLEDAVYRAVRERAADLLHGASVELHAGASLVLRVEQDEDMSIMDDECFGELVEIDYRRSHAVYGPARPAHFNGAARIVRTYTGANYWWQPPAELVRFRGSGFATDAERATALANLERTIARLLEDGYLCASLKLMQTCDRGHEHATAVASIGGIDEMYAELLEELAAELVSQL